MFYYFYILRSKVNKKLYLGYTSNLEARINHHNSGKDAATKPYIPYEVIYSSAFKDKKDALNCEVYFKTTAGWRRLHKMLENTLKK